MEEKNGGQLPEKKSGLLQQPRKVMSGLVYSAAIVLMLIVSLFFSFTVGALVSATGTSLGEIQQQDWYKYLSYGLYQIVYIGVVLLFTFLYIQRPREYGYRRTRPKYFFIALLLAFGLLFSLNWVNGLFIRFLSLIGYEAPASSLPSLAGAGVVGVLFVVAALPAVLEETVFRGIILDGIKETGTVAACLLGGLLFSLFHQSPAQTVYQFLCGAVFTLVAIRADSLYPTILMHFVNNALIILDARFGFLTGMSQTAYLWVSVASGAVLLATLAYLIFVDKSGNRKKEGECRPFVYGARVGIVAAGIMWIAALASGIGG